MLDTPKRSGEDFLTFRDEEWKKGETQGVFYLAAGRGPFSYFPGDQTKDRDSLLSLSTPVIPGKYISDSEEEQTG